MTKSISTAALAATTSILMTTTAIADVTAQQVWEDWSSYMQATGYSLSVTAQTTLGNITTLSGVVASQTLSANAKDIATIAIDYGTVTLTEADGKVIIGFDNNMQVTSSSLENSDEFNLTANIGTPGMSLIASGDDITTQYEFDVPELTFNIGEITVDGAPLNVVLDASMADYAGVYTVVRGALNHFSGGASIGLSTLTFGIGIPEEKMLINGTMSLDGLTAEFTADAPSDFDMKNFETDPMAFPEFLAVGGGFEIDYRLGAARYDVSGSQRDNNFAARGSWADAGFKLVLNATQFLFDEAATDFEITVMSSEMPFPEINLSMAEYGLNLDIPLEKSDLPKDFSAGFRLVDVRVSDFLWGMFDPTGQLPRDPATIIVDVSGKANALVDILDPMEAVGFEGMPAELHEATLNNLQVTVAGVDLRGTGAFTFDNSDLESFDGLPRPQGALDLALTGANTLLDRLIAMGLVPEEQAMGGRMMMGLFTVPGAEEDSLT